MQTPDRLDLLSKIAELRPDHFDELALAVFRYQAQCNPLYKRFVDLLGLKTDQVKTIDQIPFLPVSLFKQYEVKTGEWEPQTVFTSSSTTSQTPSKHFVRDQQFYLENTREAFTQFYGDPTEWCVLALLPSYLERTGSSLVAMADYFVSLSRFRESGFFLDELERLSTVLGACNDAGRPTLLLGVSFALLDLAEQYPANLEGVTIMETGGMKGRRKEMTRQELHAKLMTAFGVSGIHSEYGMTELFSQAYSLPDRVPKGANRFTPGPKLRAFTREINDPLCAAAPGRSGVLQFVDLANLDTCSFIATEDIGKVYTDGTFEVLGRLDAAEWRGCNLLVE